MRGSVRPDRSTAGSADAGARGEHCAAYKDVNLLALAPAPGRPARDVLVLGRIDARSSARSSPAPRSMPARAQSSAAVRPPTTWSRRVLQGEHLRARDRKAA
jgi:hypothetical protein